MYIHKNILKAALSFPLILPLNSMVEHENDNRILTSFFLDYFCHCNPLWYIVHINL